MSTHVREKPPLRHSVEVVTPSGRRYRWADDEHAPTNVPSELRWSSTMPGGYEAMDCTLPRKPGIDYADLERLTTLKVHNVLEQVGEYRLERAPRTSGTQLAVSPSAVGWQAALDDDKSAVAVPVDRDMSRWADMPLNEKLRVATAGISMGDFSWSTDSQGLTVELPNQALGAQTVAEEWYTAPAGVTVGKIAYRGTDTSYPAGYASDLSVSSTDALAASESTTLTLDDTVRVFSPAARYRYAMINMYSNGSAITPAAGSSRRLTKLAVYDASGIATQAISGEPDGVLASDVVAYTVGRWAALLTLSTGSDGTVRPSSFVIPHSAYLEPTTAGEIVKDVTKYGLQDWGVWDDRTFWWAERNTFSARWRARIGPAQLEETGPQVDRLWESILVSYTDVDGSTRIVGPPGSGADVESPDLQDSDPDNPATRLGIVRRDLLSMGTATAASATEVGRRFLEQAKLLDNSGQATLVGHVEDDRGVLHPFSKVRAGDLISFVDAADPSYRRIIKVDNTYSSRSCAIDLDAPPEGLAALLERLQVVLVPLGVG